MLSVVRAHLRWRPESGPAHERLARSISSSKPWLFAGRRRTLPSASRRFALCRGL